MVVSKVSAVRGSADMESIIKRLADKDGTPEMLSSA